MSDIPLILAISTEFPGDYSAGATPLPIPNRAVKSRSADGTDLRVGRVGRCQDSSSGAVAFAAAPFFYLYWGLWPVPGRLVVPTGPDCYAVPTVRDQLSLFLFPNPPLEWLAMPTGLLVRARLRGGVGSGSPVILTLRRGRDRLPAHLTVATNRGPICQLSRIGPRIPLRLPTSTRSRPTEEPSVASLRWRGT